MYKFNRLQKNSQNCWDFVRKDTHPLFMDIDSEIVGKNFLYMLTEDKYASELRMPLISYQLTQKRNSNQQLMKLRKMLKALT